MKFKTIDDFKVKGKTVLIRSDLNSAVSRGRVIEGPRIKASAETIRDLKKHGARVVILAHQSRPGKSDFISLRQHAKLLSKFTKVKFVNSVIDKKAVSAITSLKNGEAVLLENVRMLKEEFGSLRDNALVKVLGNICELYVNDAFSVSHRDNVSIVGFPRVLRSCVGRVMERELNGLEKLKIKNALYILAGDKKDNLKLMKRGRKVLVGGVFGHACLSASGVKLGAQEKYLEKNFENFSGWKRKLGRKLSGVKMPVDLAVRVRGKRKDLSIEDFPSEFEVFDIGPRTVEDFVSAIKKAKVVLLKGPVGYCEDAKFCCGTRELIKAMVSSSRVFSVLAGGHASSALAKTKFGKKIDYVSLAGGAFVSYLAGEMLPGLTALRNGKS